MAWAIFDESHSWAIKEIVDARSERVIAVVGGALLEEAVERTLRERLRNDPDAVKTLFAPDRPLGNVAPQIDMLYLLSAIDVDTRAALKGLAGVRNFFAHDIAATFDSSDKNFAQSLKRLALHNTRSHYPNPRSGVDSDIPIESVDSNKSRFIVNLKLGLLDLMRDRVSHRVYTNEPMTSQEIRAQFAEFQGDTPPKSQSDPA